MKWALIIAMLSAAPTMATAQDTHPLRLAPQAKAAQVKAAQAKAAHAGPHATMPLPVVIPQQFAPPQEAYASLPDIAIASAPAKPSACQLGLAKIAAFKPLPTLVGGGECGATDAVLLDTVILPDQTKVAMMPPATMRCPMADEIAQWVRDDVMPAIKTFGSPLRALDNFASYDCRGRNNIRAAQLSEHGRADALDVRDFKLADGRTLTLTDINVAKDWREIIRASACARFATVLGPGSDGFHEEHIHLDLAQRRNDYKVCEWDVREPPPVVEAKDTSQDATPPADADAADDAPQGDEAALIPLEMVPLPRPRPLAANVALHRAEKKTEDN